MTNFQSRVVFAGCAKNCARYLPDVLRNIEGISGLFVESAFVFVENNSTDGTKQILANWGGCRSNYFCITMDGLDETEPVRTRRLEFARNACIQLIRSSHLATFDYLIILDFDEVNADEFDLESFHRALDFLGETSNAAAVFANQGGTYYDLWALRHREICPGDVWEDVIDYAVSHSVSDDIACEEVFVRRVFSLPDDAAPLEVDSAFGGLGIYRMNFVINNPNPYLGYKVKSLKNNGAFQIAGWQCCEHVHFHYGIRSLGGRLFVLPWLINLKSASIDYIPSACWNFFF